MGQPGMMELPALTSEETAVSHVMRLLGPVHCETHKRTIRSPPASQHLAKCEIALIFSRDRYLHFNLRFHISSAFVNLHTFVTFF